MLIAWTMVATRAEADRLAGDAVARGLAACVQVDGPVTSHYRWKGVTEKTEEFRLSFKVLPAGLGALEAFVLERHSYETPEWIVVAAERVSEKYLSWAAANSNHSPL